MNTPDDLSIPGSALVRLDAASTTVEPVTPDPGRPGGAAAALSLAGRHEDCLVLACGPRTGTMTPGSALLAAVCPAPDGTPAVTPLLLRHGPALRASGLDTLAITGIPVEPTLLVAGQGLLRLEPAADLAGKDTEAMRRALRAHFPDSRPSLILCGPAGQRGLACAQAVLESGGSLDRGALAAWMGRHNLLAVVLLGGGPLPGTGSTTFAPSPAVPADSGRNGFAEVLQMVADGQAALPLAGRLLGRPAACFLCPRPCLAFARPEAAGSGLLCLDHAGFAATAKAQGQAAVTLLAACVRQGIDPLAAAPALAGLPAQEALAAVSAWVEGRSAPPAPAPRSGTPVLAWPDPQAAARIEAGLNLGICPILLQRCPDIPLESWSQNHG